MTLLSVGGILCATGFILKLLTTSLPILSVLLVVMGAAYFYVLSKYWKLLNLSRQLNNSGSVEQEIVELVAKTLSGQLWSLKPLFLCV